MKKIFGHILLLIIIDIMLCSFLYAQNNDRLVKLRLAQGFEEAGEWEHAIVLYEDLATLEPDNFIYLDGLQRSYTQIKEYGKAIDVIRRRLIIQPQDVFFLTTLGGLYYDSGNETAADSVWKSALAIDPNNMQSYRIVANKMFECRMYDQCIRVYLDGRLKSRKDAIFADELGTIYAALQRYTLAAEEYIRIIKTTPSNLAFVQSRLNAFIVKPEALQAVSKAVHSEVSDNTENIEMHRLYAWLLIEEQIYDSALEEYRIIDRLSNANGNELFSFGRRLQQEHAYKNASEAFKEIIDTYNNQPLLLNARFSYARALEELTEQSNTSNNYDLRSEKTYEDVFQLYNTLAAEHTSTDITAQSLYRIGIIRFEKLFDLDGALDAFNSIKKISPTSNIAHDAALKIGEIQTVRNDLAQARKEYDLLSKLNIVIYQDQAAFKLAELDYFEAKFDSALLCLNRYNSNLNTDFANDALLLQYFIQENKSSMPEALTEFAKADLLMRQRKYSESIVHFREIVLHYPTALLIDDAMMKIGELHLILRQPNDAIAAFCFVADSIQLSIVKDRAQFRIAETYQSILNNKTQAIDAYEKLLIDFPNSLYAEEARKRMRLLRGDNL